MDDGRMAGTHLAYTHPHTYLERGRESSEIEMACELPFTYLSVRLGLLPL